MLLAACSFEPKGGPDRSNPGDAGDANSVPVDTLDAFAGTVTSPWRLTLHDPMQTQDVTKAPVLVMLDPTRIDYAKVGDPKTQLRFHELDDNTDLPFEVLSWQPGDKSEIWIQVHTIQFDQPNAVDMYFGAGANGNDDATGVWSDNYQLVEHLDQNLVDSTGKHADATTVNNATVDPGHIGYAAHMHGGDGEEIAIPNDGDLFNDYSNFTFDCWLYADYADPDLQGAEPRVFDKGGPFDLARLHNGGSGELQMQIDLHFTSSKNSTHPLTIQPRNWTHLAWTYQHTDQNVRFYIDGIQDSPDNIGDRTMLVSTNDFAVGVVSSLPVMSGFIDEMRVASTGRSASYMHVQYLSGADQLISYGPPP